ncbi:MAG: thiamine pyrophosphate-dependent enzyme [Thermoplasmata archaeon]
MNKKAFFKNLYEKVIDLISLEETILNYPDKRILNHVYINIERSIADIGLSMDIGNKDFVVGYHHSIGQLIGVGYSKESIMLEILGERGGINDGNSGINHFVSLKKRYMSTTIIGDNLSIALGLAMAYKKKKNKGKVIVFFGEGTASNGSMHEALNISSLFNLPILFVCFTDGKVLTVKSTNVIANQEIWKMVKWYGISSKRISSIDIDSIYEIRKSTKNPFLLQVMVPTIKNEKKKEYIIEILKKKAPKFKCLGSEIDKKINESS